MATKVSINSERSVRLLLEEIEELAGTQKDVSVGMRLDNMLKTYQRLANVTRYLGNAQRANDIFVRAGWQQLASEEREKLLEDLERRKS